MSCTSALLDEFLTASRGLQTLPKELLPELMQFPIYRYSVLHANSPRGHACPYCRILLRKHEETWSRVRPWFETMNKYLDVQAALDAGDALGGCDDKED